VVSEKSTRGKIVGLIGDGVPRSVSRIAAELGVEVRSVFWARYDLYRLGLVLRSAEPVGVPSLEFVGGQVKRLREFAYLASSDEVSKDIVVDGVRYVRSQFADSPAGVRSSSSYGETVRSQVMKVLDDGQPRAIRQLAQELGMSEARAYNSLYLLYKCGAVLRTEKAQAQESARRWEKKPAHNLWTVSPEGEKDTIIAGQKYIGYRKRNGKTTSQQIIDYVREHLHDKAAFTTQLRKDREKQLGAVERVQPLIHHYWRIHPLLDLSHPFHVPSWNRLLCNQDIIPLQLLNRPDGSIDVPRSIGVNSYPHTVSHRLSDRLHVLDIYAMIRNTYLQLHFLEASTGIVCGVFRDFLRSIEIYYASYWNSLRRTSPNYLVDGYTAVSSHQIIQGHINARSRERIDLRD